MDFSKLSELMDHFTSWRIPGNSCVVYKDRKPVFKYSSGYSDIESGKKMCGDELLYMFSATKPVVCAAGLTLWEKGKLDLDAPVSKYLPEWDNMTYVSRDENGNEIVLPVPADRKATVKQLFSMTAGMDYMTETEAQLAARERTAPRCPTREIVRAMAERPLRFIPGEHWNYSLCHDVLGAVIEVAADMTLADYVGETIIKPVGMKNTEFGIRDERRARMATMYCFNDTTVRIEKNPTQDNWSIFGTEYHSGGAGLTSTVGDMAMFTEMMSAGGITIGGERIIKEETLDMMRRNHLSPQQMVDFNWSHLAGYGYGLGVRTLVDPASVNTKAPVGEYGWTGAAGAFMLIDPTNHVAMFYAHHMLNNQEYYTAPRLRDTLYECLEK